MQKTVFYLSAKRYLFDTAMGILVCLTASIITGNIIYKNDYLCLVKIYGILPFILIFTCVSLKKKISLLPLTLKSMTPWIQLDSFGIHFPHTGKSISWHTIEKIDFCNRIGSVKTSPCIYIFHENQITLIKEHLDAPLINVASLLEIYLTEYKLSLFMSI